MNPANDNEPRPAWFDEKLAAHIRLVEKLSRRYERVDPEDFKQDLLARLVERWADYNSQFAFSTWIFIAAMNVAGERRKYRNRQCRKAEMVELEPEAAISVNTDPTDAIELKRLLSELVGTRDGDMLLRYVSGDFLREIAADHGIGKERVRQLIEKARERIAA